jgi:predicted ATPase
MPLPEPLSDHISSARSFINRANTLDLSICTRNAEACLGSARALLVQDASIAAAFEEAERRIVDFRNEGADNFGFSDRQRAALENARQVALLGLDELVGYLADARPNEHARALGLDWF